jgi:hypothetical protein
MLAAFIDHVWQSVLTLAVLAAAALVARGNSAIVRRWIWRIAAIKFLVPFRALVVLGACLGYPISRAEDTVPEPLTETLASVMPFFTPAQSRELAGWSLTACLAVVLLAIVACIRLIHERLRTETAHASREFARTELDPDDTAPGLGFVRGLLFAAVTMVAFAAPVLAGAINDRLARHDLLVADARSLFDAPIAMQPAAPGMGQRVRVTTSPRGVLVRNASIQELTALSYGVTLGFVWSDHFAERGNEDWFTDARYDVRITGKIQDPARFDTYALRIPVTRMLAQRYRLEIYVEDHCQPPCGRYGVTIPEDSL